MHASMHVCRSTQIQFIYTHLGLLRACGHYAGDDVWGLQLPACVLQPGESKEGAITFQPAAAQRYALRMPFEVNGLFTVSVEVMNGQGNGAAWSLMRGHVDGTVECNFVADDELHWALQACLQKSTSNVVRHRRFWSYMRERAAPERTMRYATCVCSCQGRVRQCALSQWTLPSVRSTSEQ